MATEIYILTGEINDLPPEVIAQNRAITECIKFFSY